MLKFFGLLVFSLLYDVQIVVSPKERTQNETLQDVQRSIPPVVHQGCVSDAQAKPCDVEPDARWNPPLNGLP